METCCIKEGIVGIIGVSVSECFPRIRLFKKEGRNDDRLDRVRWKVLFCIGRAVAALCLLASCSRPEPNRVQGYVEGEFVYVASPYAGALGSLYVRRGAQVKVGDPLFALENTSERTGRDEARRRLAQAHANLEDAKKGKRPSEIESIEAQLKQARSALVLSEREYARQEQLLRIPGATSQQDIDRARFTRDQDGQRVAQAEADLKTAQLGARTDQVAAAEAEVRAREATLARAEWDLSQKRQNAPQGRSGF